MSDLAKTLLQAIICSGPGPVWHGFKKMFGKLVLLSLEKACVIFYDPEPRQTKLTNFLASSAYLVPSPGNNFFNYFIQ